MKTQVRLLEDKITHNGSYYKGEILTIEKWIVFNDNGIAAICIAANGRFIICEPREIEFVTYINIEL